MDAEAGTLSPAQAVGRRTMARFAPADRLTCSQYADSKLVVTVGPMAGTRWQTSFAEFQRGIMDAFHEPGVTHVVVRGSSQWGKTSMAVALAAYHIEHDPCPILIVEPTVDPMAKDFAKNRLDVLIREVPSLSACVSRKRQAGGSNTTLQKTFRGGSLSIAGAESPASLAARSIRFLVLDEVDRYPAEVGEEGSPLSLAMKRTTAYRRKKRILMLGSPTLVEGPISQWYELGDRRQFHVPCPECGDMHPYRWADVVWRDNDPATARLRCPACTYEVDEIERIDAVAYGQWVAGNLDREDKAIVSFHIWEAYSPLSSLRDIVAEFLRVRRLQKAGSRAEMRAWQNTTLGEPVDPEEAEKVEPTTLLMRKEALPDGAHLPEWVCGLTAGIDTQDDRLEVLVWGWGPGEEGIVVDRWTIPGDTSRPDAWDVLDELWSRTYRHEWGVDLPLLAACIDSAGHRSTMVYDYCHKWEHRQVYAIIGRDGPRAMTSSPTQRRWGRGERRCPLYTLGVDSAKALLYSRLRLTMKGPGYIHLPQRDWCDEEFAAQLTAEKLVKRRVRGHLEENWVKIRTRNETLDCAVYGLCALRLRNVNLENLADQLRELKGQGPQGPKTPGRAPSNPGRRVIRSGYLSGGGR